jgi:hypothetical protein
VPAPHRAAPARQGAHPREERDPGRPDPRPQRRKPVSDLFGVTGPTSAALTASARWSATSASIARSPVRIEPGTPRQEHRGGLGLGPSHPRGAAWDRGALTRAAAAFSDRLPCAPLRAGRGRRDRAQARHPVLVSAHARAGLRVWPAIADAPRDPRARARRHTPPTSALRFRQSLAPIRTLPQEPPHDQPT